MLKRRAWMIKTLEAMSVIEMTRAADCFDED